MSRTGISWTHRTWNVTRGCTCVSSGCELCYAKEIAGRFSGAGQAYEGLATRKKMVRNGSLVVLSQWTGDVRFVGEKLTDPITWRDPCLVFVNSMSDLFHDGFSNEQIAAVFGVMAATPRHVYQILTKRPERLPAWFAWVVSTAAERGITPAYLCFILAREIGAADANCVKALDRTPARAAATNVGWPLSNVWIGVSTEDQETAAVRLPFLVKVPAVVRFVSAEPLLGPIDLKPWLREIAWVIAGCESGDRRRDANAGWFRLLRDQCVTFGTAFFLKQAVGGAGISLGCGSKNKMKGIIETPALDGSVWTQFPQKPRPSSDPSFDTAPDLPTVPAPQNGAHS